MKSIFFLTMLVAFSLVAGPGCASDECRQMQKCCAEVSDVEGMGAACGDLAKNVTKPETCRSVVKTVSYMYEDRGLELPQACVVAPPK